MSFQYRPPLPLLSNLEKISSNFSCTAQAWLLIFAEGAVGLQTGCMLIVPVSVMSQLNPHAYTL